MDPITQGLLGGVATQVVLRKKAEARLAFAGVVGAMAPDLDVLIRSTQDPLLSLEYHRHFTHSLFFIPFGGLVVATLLWLLYRRKISFVWVYLAATVGYATHGVLDACTSYGTLLFWPFSYERVAWDSVFVIDVFFTFILFVGFFLTLWRKRTLPAVLALALTLSYLGLGFYQQQRGLEFQTQLAAERGHKIERGRVIPTFSNLWVWRSIYESEGRFYVDALRVLPWGSAQWWEGDSVPKFQNQALQLPKDSVLNQNVALYVWFSSNYLTPRSEHPILLGDLRFSTFPNGVNPIWGIRFNPLKPNRPVEKVRFSTSFDQAWEILKAMLQGTYPGARALLKS